MSNRAERRRRTAVIVAKRSKQLNLIGLSFENEPQSWICYSDWRKDEDWESYKKRIMDKRLGRCRKRNPFNCGNPRCYICNTFKRELTNSEKRAELSFKEQIEEI